MLKRRRTGHFPSEVFNVPCPSTRRAEGAAALQLNTISVSQGENGHSSTHCKPFAQSFAEDVWCYFGFQPVNENEELHQNQKHNNKTPTNKQTNLQRPFSCDAVRKSRKLPWLRLTVPTLQKATGVVNKKHLAPAPHALIIYSDFLNYCLELDR